MGVVATVDSIGRALGSTKTKGLASEEITLDLAEANVPVAVDVHVFEVLEFSERPGLHCELGKAAGIFCKAHNVLAVTGVTLLGKIKVNCRASHRAPLHDLCNVQLYHLSLL